jgi:hypothetical protein
VTVLFYGEYKEISAIGAAFQIAAITKYHDISGNIGIDKIPGRAAEFGLN